ncbi:MAG: hypothetical protein AAF614_03250 [Chloroflexota bacterium]
MTTPIVFTTYIRHALEHFHDPDWLGTHSPLATPYFLGHHLSNETTAVLRGRVLQTVLHQAATALWDGALPSSSQQLVAEALTERDGLGATKSRRYHYLLLELYYFRHYFAPQQPPLAKVNDILAFVATSKTRFFSHLKKVIPQLGEQLLRQVQPTFRLESPRIPRELVGRNDLLTRCLRGLKQGEAVAISGGGGMGKTALGTAVCAAWPHPVFWYTIRPGLNDQLDSFLFALGHFLYQQGASKLWLQTLAAQGKLLDTNLALGLLRDDLQTVATLLICVDEIDRLGQLMERSARHSQLLELLESLQHEAPLLLIGQNIPLDLPHHLALDGLTKSQIETFLARAGISLDATTMQRLQQQTHGNPRLLEILVALYKSGAEPFADWAQLRRAPALASLLERLWKRLSAAEQSLLGQLAVFQQAAPADVWQAQDGVLDALIDRLLIQQDGQGGITLLPLIRDLLYQQLLPEQRDAYHRQAAGLWVARGAYTAAAYHWWRAGEVETAVSTWYPQRQLEVERGQAPAALHIFGQISLNRVQGNAQRQLKLIRNQLYLLRGQAENVLKDVQPLSWPPTPEAQQEKAAVETQEAEATTMLGEYDAALEKYDAALMTLAQITNTTLEARFKRNTIHFSTGNQQAALAELQQAKFETARLEGYIQWRTGNFAQAREHLTQASSLAVQPQAKAQIDGLLSANASRSGHLDQARQHAERSITYYQQIGDRFNAERTRANLAGAYIDAGDFGPAITLSEQTLPFFKQINNGGWVATISSNLAEAYYETGNIEKAKEMAFAVLHLEDQYTHPYALYTLGLVHQHEGAWQNAAESFQRGIVVAQQNADKFIEAYLHRALGKLCQTQGREQLATRSLQTALAYFSEMGLTHEANETEALI